MNFPLAPALEAAGVLLLGAALLLLLRRKRKSAAEMERERRLAVNAVGRITDGFLIESDRAAGDGNQAGLIFYRYSAAGMDYTAAQDLSSLPRLAEAGSGSPGAVTHVKYDPQRPSNSIVACEEWNGLPVAGKPGSGIRNRHSGIRGPNPETA